MVLQTLLLKCCHIWFGRLTGVDGVSVCLDPLSCYTGVGASQRR